MLIMRWPLTREALKIPMIFAHGLSGADVGRGRKGLGDRRRRHRWNNQEALSISENGEVLLRGGSALYDIC